MKSLDSEALRRILGHYLIDHLNFTDLLEHDVVNKITYRLARDELAVSLPDPMRRDAYKIYVDEAFHSCTTSDLRLEIESSIGRVTPRGQPEFLNRLQQIQQKLPTRLRDLAMLCFAIVSETLISRVLRDIPRDTTVVQGVRDVIADHGHDEAIHHVYFSQVFEEIWHQFQRKIRLR